MWPHTIIALLGLWLALSPLVFRIDHTQSFVWVHEIGLGVLIMGLAGFSTYRKLDALRGLTALVSFYLIVKAYFFYSHPRPPIEQNHLVLGLLILMFAILPRWTNLPPQAHNR